MKNGDIAVRRFPPNPQIVQIPGGAYLFEVRNSIAMAWVKPEHIQYILSLRKVCCGGNVTKPYHIADLSAVKLWSGMEVR